MARPRTVISPELPKRETKAKPSVEVVWRPRPGQPMWRLRTTSDMNPKTASRYFQDEPAPEPGCVVETLTAGTWGQVPRKVTTVAELAAEGLAREVAVKAGTRWEISSLGQQMILDSMAGD